MKIYTKQGDAGKTALYGGRKVSKSDLQIEAYGTIDELNSNIGFLAAHVEDKSVLELLLKCQQDLFVIGSQLAIDFDNPKKLKLPALPEERILEFESEIDRMDSALKPLTQFILPSGSKAVAAAHISRTVCRRSERRVVAISEHLDFDPVILIYLNRFSDYLFVLARYIAHSQGIADVCWLPPL